MDTLNWTDALTTHQKLIPNVFRLSAAMLTSEGETHQRTVRKDKPDEYTANVVFDTAYVAYRIAQLLRQCDVDVDDEDTIDMLMETALEPEIWKLAEPAERTDTTVPHNLKVIAEHLGITVQEVEERLKTLATSEVV